MSNGSAGVGAISFKQDEGTYHVSVGEAWNSAQNWVTAGIDLDGKGLCEWDLDCGQVRELAALLLTAAGNQDLAEAIPLAMDRIAERERIREQARAEMREATRVAEQEFINATGSERKAYVAAVTQAEQAFAEATGETIRASRYVSLAPEPDDIISSERAANGGWVKLPDWTVELPS